MSTEELTSTVARVQKNKLGPTSSIKERSSKHIQASSLQGLPSEELVQFLCVLEAEVQARDLIISSVMRGEIGSSLPLSHLLGDGNHAKLIRGQDQQINEDDDELWLGEPTAHLNHVVAYHQLVREQMQSMMQSLQEQHKTILQQLENEQRKHAIDTAQGDEVTYMLEKERERLTNEIEFEQGKLLKVEKERDKLQMMLEKEREQHQHEFNLLVNDFKMFAKQLIDQAQKEEQLTKEIEQEKRKTRALSELMVEEQKKYKERFKVLDDERKEKQILLQQKQDLETKLYESEKRAKEAYQKYTQESSRVKALEYEMKQLITNYSAIYSSEPPENGDELVVVEPTDLGSRDAKIAQLQEDNERLVPCLTAFNTANTTQIESKFAKQHLTNVVKSVAVSHNKGTVSKSKPASPVITAKINPSSKSASSSPNMPSKEITGNDQDMINRKVPPPTPPRVSSITARSVPVLPSDSDGSFMSAGHFVRSNSVGAGVNNRSTMEPVTRYERRQTLGSRSDRIFLDVSVATNFGWQFFKEQGLVQSRRVVDYLGEISLFQNTSWEALTESVNKMFIENFPSRVWQDQNHTNSGLSLSSIRQYGLLGIIWTYEMCPIGEKPWEFCSKRRDNQEMLLTIWLKDETTVNFDSLAYSTTLPFSDLKEYFRLIQKYKNVFFLTDDVLEAKHFVSCLSNWLKVTEDTRQRKSLVASIEESEISNEKDFINLLLDHGVLISAGEPIGKQHSTIVLIDVDFVISNNVSTDLLLWVGRRGMNEAIYFSNELHFNNTAYYLNEDVIVLAYASRTNLSSLNQGIYRVFKVVDLPPTMPYLLQRWLRQKAYQCTTTELDVKEVDDWVRWIADVYRRTRIDLERLDIQLELLDLSLFLSAPVDETCRLKSWAEELWAHHFYNIIENSIQAQVVEASRSQQEVLLQVALKTVFENALLPGCPVRLDVENDKLL